MTEPGLEARIGPLEAATKSIRKRKFLFGSTNTPKEPQRQRLHRIFDYGEIFIGNAIPVANFLVVDVFCPNRGEFFQITARNHDPIKAARLESFKTVLQALLGTRQESQIVFRGAAPLLEYFHALMHIQTD